MTLVPEIHDQIRATARRRATAGPGRRRRSGRSHRAGGWVLVTASMLVVAGVVAVIVLAGGAHDLANPAPTSPGRPGGPPPKGWVQLSESATRQTWARDPSCEPRPQPAHQPFRQDAPPRDLTSQLAVLRHPTPARERVSSETLDRSIRALPLDLFARGIYLRYVHRGQMNGISYYLIPAADVIQSLPVPERCYREQLAAFRQRTAKLPTAEQAPLISYEISELQTARTAARHPDGVCLVHIGGGGIGHGPCSTAITLRQPPGMGSGGNNQSTVTAMIVPDRVATVTARYSPQTYPGRVLRAVTVTHRAINTVVIFNFRGAWDPPSALIYRSASGSIIWSRSRR